MTLPISLWFFVAAIGALILQSIPIIGVVLLLLLAPFWSIIFINAGFAGIAAEVSVRRVNLVWIILPIIWFGSYALFAYRDHQQLRDLQRDISAHNGPVQIPFDSKRHALVFDEGNDQGAWYVTNTTLPIAYETNKHQTTARHLSSRMVDQSVSNEVRNDRTARGAFIHTFGFHDDSNQIAGRRFERSFSHLRMPEDPTFPRVLVSTVELKNPSNIGLHLSETRTIITMPDGRRFELRGGYAAPLPWFPMPLLGCGLNRGASCSLEFHRNTFTPLIDNGSRYRSQQIILAKALGLARVEPENRKPHDSVEALAAIAKATTEVVAHEIASLDRALSDVQAQIGSLPFRAISHSLDVIRPRIERIIAAVERGIQEGRNGRNNAQQLFHLLESVPAETIAPHMPRIAALKFKDSWFVFRSKAG